MVRLESQTRNPKVTGSSLGPAGTLSGGKWISSALSTLNTTTEVPLSKPPNPHLLPGRCKINGCPLLRVRIHLRWVQYRKMFMSLSLGPDCRWGSVLSTFNTKDMVYISTYQDWGALEQGTEPLTAPRAPQQAAHCSGCVFTVCVCVHCCVCALWKGKCRARIPSVGQHTWPYVTPLSLVSLSFDFISCGKGKAPWNTLHEQI